MYRLGPCLLNLIEIYDVYTIFLYIFIIYTFVLYRKKDLSQNLYFVI